MHVRCVICKPYRLMASLYHGFPCLLCVMCKPCRLLRTAHTIARHCVHDCSSQNLKLRVKGDADVLVSCSLFPMFWCPALSSWFGVWSLFMCSCLALSSAQCALPAKRRAGNWFPRLRGTKRNQPRRMSCGALLISTGTSFGMSVGF